MYCKHCGARLREGNKFCIACGKPSSFTSEHEKPKADAPVSSPSAQTRILSVIKTWRNRRTVGVTAGAIIVILIFAWVFHMSGNDASHLAATSDANTQSVVDVLCDNNQGGSGVIFTKDGTVLTNNHVIVGARSCQVTIPNPATGEISEIYNAAPVITPILSEQYDVATLKIDGSYTDSSGTTWGTYPTDFAAFTLPGTCDTSTASQLDDAVRIYGYPVTSGGYNLTVTDGVISSFADNGDILTSAKVDSGNSGGLAVDQNGCWLGIPSAVVTGNVQNLGVIIPGSVVENFLSGVPAKHEPVAISSSTEALSALTPATPQETNNQLCQGSFGTFSQWSGKSDASGNPTCVCQTGYSWNGSGDACATQLSLQQWCQNQYGDGSYSYTKSGKAVCGCSSGYIWNSDQTACIAPTNNQVCQSQYGEYSQWSGELGSNGLPTCLCQSGYSWDTTGNSCASDYSLNQGCENTFGAGSYSYTQGGKAVCGCRAGYTWNSDQTACVVQESNDQICQDKYGANSQWNGTTNSQGGLNCDCQTGYAWNSDQTVCIYSGY